ncbi:uncharacterized protein EAF01_009010 [Botrytis porri]|uniref:uncharacterized protein n=1 Tax=Botrytis porri TaxID=87229 RepID=UPI00190078DA|nr:uncharacterized protein EAF01_009010 [Botrytis porri]KAF7896607.1 hypothetical protein EAF01_009010 [Botrytis porri]
MTSTKIIMWTGMLLATAFATATVYSFFRDSHYKFLTYFRFPSIFLFPAILYFIMEFDVQQVMELINAASTFFRDIVQYFDIQKIAEIITKLPLPFWLITALTICILGAHSIAASFFKEYFQQTEYAAQSTSAVLHTVNHIFTSPQACLQTVFGGLQACFPMIFMGVTSHFPTVCLSILFCLGIVLFVASFLFSKGNQQRAFVLIAVILASPVSNWF